MIFLSYASEDIEKAKKIYKGLTNKGLEVWFDKENLKPGLWKPQIEKAIFKSKFFLICISEVALSKLDKSAGFQEEELSYAYHIAQKQSPTEFTLIPIRFEDCGRGDHRLSIFQQYDFYPKVEFANKLNELAENLGAIKDEVIESGILVEGLISRCQAFIYTSEYEKADKLIDSAIEIDSQNSKLYHIRATIYEMINNESAALEYYNKAIEIDSENPIYYNNRGYLLLKMKKFDKSLEDYNLSLLYNPKGIIPLCNRALNYMLIGKDDQALIDFNSAIKIDPENEVVYSYRGDYFLSIKKYSEAINDYDKVISINPLNKLKYKERGFAKYCQKKYYDAIVDFENAIKLDVNFRDAYWKRALASEDLGEFKLALKDYNKVIEIEQTSAALANRSLIHYKLGNEEHAFSDCELAVELNPDDEVAQHILEQLESFRLFKSINPNMNIKFGFKNTDDI